MDRIPNGVVHPSKNPTPKFVEDFRARSSLPPEPYPEEAIRQVIQRMEADLEALREKIRDKERTLRELQSLLR